MGLSRADGTRDEKGAAPWAGGPSGPKPVMEGDVVEVEVVEKSRRGD